MNMQSIIYKYKSKLRNPPRKYLKSLLRLSLLLCLLIPIFTVFASAETPEYAVEHWLDKLRDILPDAISDKVQLSDEEDVSKLVGIPYILSLIYGGLTDKLPSLMGVLASMFGMALLGGMSGLLQDGIKGEQTQKVVGVVLSAGLSLALYEMTFPALWRGLSAIADITDFTSALVPIMGGVYVAGGNYATAATQSGALTWLVAELNALSNGILRSLMSASFAFALLGALGTGVDTSDIAKSLRRIVIVVMGVIATLFSGSLALQTTLSASTDSVAMRTAKYAVGQMIPTVGSTISGTLSTVAVSVGLIKSTVGAGGVGILLTLLLPPLVELYLFSLSLSLSKSFCALLGFRTGEKLFADFQSIFDMAMGVLAISGVMLLLSLGIFMKSTVAVG